MFKVLQFILAKFLKLLFIVPLSIINILWSIFTLGLPSYLKGIALSEDVLGNYVGKYLFTFLFLKKESKLKFGEPVIIENKNHHVTISYVMAKAYNEKTLTIFGVYFAKLLILFKDKAFNQ